ncbi:unnamed protein product [Clonostachys rosea f. rosea IK726]|uniref:Uncharacterized protein n=1 Tax=Clonostachys rosea f. rosea IK726 TaxID=1349383 RepID=A0ACA9U925_BIOOC|nr:unnamed protein product [Clonostachys rosea f. rosea IK726]
MFNLNGIVEPYSFWVVYHETELPRSVDSYAIVESFLLEMHYYKSWSTQPAVLIWKFFGAIQKVGGLGKQIALAGGLVT